MPDVTVAIPVRDGGALLGRALRALATQTIAHELLVCDSGSSDGSVALAREHGARVLEIPPSRFSHGGTRNLLISESAGARVALLTQDAEPADERWLERLLDGFDLAPNVGLVYGRYSPRRGAAPAVRLELNRWFDSLSPSAVARVERLEEGERTPASALIGPRGFFTDANACISRDAWRAVPFREVPYAEDRVLAVDMLRAGYAKAYVPDAAVLHSHDYTAWEELGRCFDEWRGLREVYDWREPRSPGHVLRKLRGELSAARAQLEREGASGLRRRATLAAVARHHVVRLTGATLGSEAEHLPPRVRRALSLEGRPSFEALHLVGEQSQDTPETPLPQDE